MADHSGPDHALDHPRTALTEIDIFGGDSDLSEQDDDDDDDDHVTPDSPAPAPPQKRPAPSDSEGSEAPPPSDDDDEDDEDDDVGKDAEYKDAGADREGGLKSLKIKKKKVERAEGDEEPRRKKKKITQKSKRRETAEEEEEEEVVDPETARRRALDARIEAIVKRPKSKSTGRKKRGGADEDDLDLMNDEAVVRLRDQMMVAADQDLDDNDQARFAVNKLRLLPRVVDMMQKSSLAESLVDNGVLEAVRRWLEPLHDKSLPALNIQRALFEILPTLSIETSALKSSGLGKIVYFYTKCKRVEPFIARIANQLVSDWMRPIIRRSKVFADKDLLAGVDDEDDDVAEVGDRLKSEREDKVARRHARIPEMLTKAFKIAPESDMKMRHGGERMLSGPTGTGNKMRSYKKKLIAGQLASKRV